jgi:hypothetical protein
VLDEGRPLPLALLDSKLTRFLRIPFCCSLGSLLGGLKKSARMLLSITSLFMLPVLLNLELGLAEKAPGVRILSWLKEVL